MKIRDHAQGKWKLIVTELIEEKYANTSKHQPCPKGQGEDCFRFSDRDGTGNFFCKCSGGEKDGFDLLMCVHGWDFAAAAKEVEAVIGKAPGDGESPKNEREHWSFGVTRQARHYPRSRYLLQRGIPSVPKHLLFHPEFPYTQKDSVGRVVTKGHYPAMLSRIMHGRKWKATHVTYLDRKDSSKKASDVGAVRKVLGGKGLKGAAVPLYPVKGEVMGVAEGVETAISAHLLSRRTVPVWAVLNTSLMESFTPPHGVKTVVIYGDNDRSYAGHASAYKLAHRLIGQGFEVEVVFPEEVGTDWNDVLVRFKERKPRMRAA